MRDPLNRTAQKRVAADTINEGDMIYRRAPDGGAVMMIIEKASTGTHEGVDVFVWSGTVYSLQGDGAGPNPNFLGEHDPPSHRPG